MKTNMKTSTPCVLLWIIAVSYFTFLTSSQAVTPAPDGGYPGQNTAEGDYALYLATGHGINNTGVGFQALYGLKTGNNNTAVGAIALLSNQSADKHRSRGFGPEQ